MPRAVKNDLSSHATAILKNNRITLKTYKNLNNPPKNAKKQENNNIVSIIPFLNRDNEFGDFTA